MKQLYPLCHIFTFLMSAHLVLFSGVKVPSEVIKEAESLFKKHRQASDGQQDFCYKDKEKLGTLLADLLLVSHMCQRSLDSDKKLLKWLESGNAPVPEAAADIHDFICLYQESVDRSEVTPEEFCDEFNLLRTDCLFNCKEYKQEINRMIPELFAMMRKTNEPAMLSEDVLKK